MPKPLTLEQVRELREQNGKVSHTCNCGCAVMCTAVPSLLDTLEAALKVVEASDKLLAIMSEFPKEPYAWQGWIEGLEGSLAPFLGKE